MTRAQMRRLIGGVFCLVYVVVSAGATAPYIARTIRRFGDWVPRPVPTRNRPGDRLEPGPGRTVPPQQV
jgi:hypothetical protein